MSITVQRVATADIHPTAKWAKDHATKSYQSNWERVALEAGTLGEFAFSEIKKAVKLGEFSCLVKIDSSVSYRAIQISQSYLQKQGFQVRTNKLEKSLYIAWN